MKFILAKKVAMTRVFGEDGRARAGTILMATPMTVTQVKSVEGADKYGAVQVGSGKRKVKNISNAVLGHTKGKGFTTIREFKTTDASEIGKEIGVDTFAVGDVVDVSGLT